MAEHVTELGTIENTFKTWYATKNVVTTIVPDTSVFVGDVQGEQDSPYVVIEAELENDFNTNSGSGDVADLTLSGYFADFQDGRTFQESTKNAFDRQVTSDTVNVVTLCRIVARTHEQEESGLWRFDAVFRVKYQEQ